MKILAIESSCDETAAAVVEDGRKVLASVIASQVKEHIKFGGVVPEVASRLHTEAVSFVVQEALDKADCKLNDIDAIGVTFAPGLIGALLVGVNFAKGLSYSAGIPLVPVHHLRSHIASNYITHENLEPPFMCLVVSGGHSHIIEVKDYTEFNIIGRTHDDAAGEALDKAARAMGLPYPGGLNMDKRCANGNPEAYPFPRPRVDNCPYDFSFSGLKTAVLNTINNAKQKNQEINIEDLGASYMNAVTRCLIENLQSAALKTGYKKIVLAGGVSANSVLRKKAEQMCRNNGWELYVPHLSLCGDNAAMVGSQAYYEYKNGNIADLKLNAIASLPIDYAIRERLCD